jgi:dihydrofolate synthase / folylpolyglutamate synthase
MKMASHSFLNQLLARRGYQQEHRTAASRFLALEAVLQDIQQYSAYKSIHIAGSKGKGSTASYIAATLQQLGYTTLLFTSPHLCDVRERFNYQGRLIDEPHFEAALEWLAQRESSTKLQLPFFDAMTCLIFYLAKTLVVDFLILETGLGGRLDATNICTPCLTIITPIELEHTAILGDTLSAIAYEKAGIIKKKIPLFLARQEPSAYKVFETVAKELKSPLFYFEDLFDIKNSHLSSDGLYRFNYKTNSITAQFATKLQIIVQNALLALAALDFIFTKDSVLASWQQAVAKTQLLGRYHQLNDQAIVLDVSHTPLSFHHTVTTFTNQFNSYNRILIFGCASDKDFYGMAKKFTYFDKVYLVSPKHTSQSMADYEITHSNWQYRSSLSDVLSQQPLAQDEALLIAGSFYLVGEAMSIYGL